MSTHQVELRADTVVKRFTGTAGDEPAREWRALDLLARYAPGLAPEPRAAALDADPPTVEMSRLDGVPMSELRLGPTHLDALTAALTAMHRRVPCDVLPEEPLRADVLHARVRAMTASPLDGAAASVARAYAAGVEWLRAWTPEGTGVTPVFGIGDHNLANFLWADGRVGVVDFEDSGRSDRAFEVADLVEWGGRLQMITFS